MVPEVRTCLPTWVLVLEQGFDRKILSVGRLWGAGHSASIPERLGARHAGRPFVRNKFKHCHGIAARFQGTSLAFAAKRRSVEDENS